MRETRKLLFKKGDTAKQVRDLKHLENPIVTILEDVYVGDSEVKHRHKGCSDIMRANSNSFIPIKNKDQITWSERYGSS